MRIAATRAPSRLAGSRKTLNSTSVREIRHVYEFHAGNPQIRSVGPEPAHGFGIGQFRKRIQQGNPHGIKHGACQTFHQFQDVFLFEKRSFDVDLSEFRLAVLTGILVAEAAHNLVVTVHSAHHQHLLEQLRGLWKCKTRTGVGPARYQVFASAFRGRTGQHRCLDFQKPQSVQVTPHRGRQPGTGAQALLHHGPAQLHVAIAQAMVFVHLFVVELVRRGIRRI